MLYKRVFAFLSTMTLILAVANTSLAGPGNGRNTGGDGEISSLSHQEEHHLLFMREEEKLARDVYDQLFIDYGNLIFDNISNSEQNHMDAMKVLLDRYGLEDPILAPGVFADPSLNELWDALMSVADEGPVWALVVGAWIEETDIIDIQVAIEETGHEDINSTYESLMCGSRNHLRAFISQLEAIGITDFDEFNIPLGYANPDYPEINLDSDEFWAIAHGQMERDCGADDNDDEDDASPNGKRKN